MSQAAAAVPASELEVLLGKEDAYSGVLVDPEGLPLDAQQFSDQLRHSLQVPAVRQSSLFSLI